MIRIFPALMAPSYVVCIPVFADRGPTPPGVAAPPEPRKLKSSTRAPRRAAGRAREPRVDQRREFADVPERLVPFARQSGMASKWWALDVVFGRPLTSRQERRLRLALRGGDDDWYAVLAGERRGPERRRWTRLRRRLGGMDGWATRAKPARIGGEDAARLVAVALAAGDVVEVTTGDAFLDAWLATEGADELAALGARVAGAAPVPSSAAPPPWDVAPPVPRVSASPPRDAAAARMAALVAAVGAAREAA